MKKLKSLGISGLLTVMLSGCTYYVPGSSVAAGDQTDPNIRQYKASCEYVIGIPIGDQKCSIADIIKRNNLRKTYSSDAKVFDFLNLYQKRTTIIRGTQ